MNIETRDTFKEIRPHSLLKAIPVEDGVVFACADAIRDMGGFVLPIFIDEDNHIVTDDSVVRWMAAKRMQLAEVPVVILPTLVGPAVIGNSLAHRAHYTKSAIAYLAVPLLEPAFEAAVAHRRECLKTGQKPVVHSVHYGKKVEDYAEVMGVSRRLLFQAKQVHAEFDKDKTKYPFTVEGGGDDGKEVLLTLREYYEPKILRPAKGGEHEGGLPVGLGAIMAGIASIRGTKGEARPPTKQLELFQSALKSANKFRYWTDLKPEEKKLARATLREWVAEIPPEMMDEIVDLIKARRKVAA